ncbi:MAG: hypothetical protein QQW96_17060 [Tychonema bourrellyi B0820]|nr:hypothetical protein [Tychonema bourrellyi B0820]
MLEHSQLAFYEQARCLFHKKVESLWNRPESLLLTASCLFHKKVESLWNRPESLLLTMVQHLSYIKQIWR